MRTLSASWIHLLLNVTILLLTLWSFARRLDEPAAAVLPLGLVVSAIVVVLLLASGWYGGELVYRHKIGAVDGAIEGPAEAPPPIANASPR